MVLFQFVALAALIGGVVAATIYTPPQDRRYVAIAGTLAIIGLILHRMVVNSDNTGLLYVAYLMFGAAGILGTMAAWNLTGILEERFPPAYMGMVAFQCVALLGVHFYVIPFINNSVSGEIETYANINRMMGYVSLLIATTMPFGVVASRMVSHRRRLIREDE